MHLPFSPALVVLQRLNRLVRYRTLAPDAVETATTTNAKLGASLRTEERWAEVRALRLQPTDLAAVIDSTVALARHSREAQSVDFRRTIREPLPEVECDSEQVKQVLLNLLMNAIQATGAGTVDLEAYAENECVFLRIQDAGVGIPASEEKRIFEPFFTTKSNGTGLGLAIARNIVDQHGGSLTAHNTEGKGLTMLVQLPVKQVHA